MSKLDRNKIEFNVAFNIDKEMEEDSNIDIVARNKAQYFMGLGQEIQKVKGESMWSSQEGEGETLHSARLFVFTPAELKEYTRQIREGER